MKLRFLKARRQPENPPVGEGSIGPVLTIA